MSSRTRQAKVKTPDSPGPQRTPAAATNSAVALSPAGATTIPAGPNIPRQLKQAEQLAQLRSAADDAPQGGLPAKLRSGIEALSGIDMSGVRVHRNSSQPAALQAHAYAQGRDIHLGPGQEEHLPHEAWHVVQQAQGRVGATRQMKGGVPINDDQGLEHEADVMGAKALQMGGNGDGDLSATSSQPQRPSSGSATNLAQLAKLKTAGGTWEDTEYREARAGDPGITDMSIFNGVRIKIDFTPAHPAESDLIGISQSVKSEQKKPSQVAQNPFHTSRVGDQGYQIDQVDPKTNPLYAGKGTHTKGTDLAQDGADDWLGKHGKRVKSADKWDVEAAKLEDTPVLWKYVDGNSSNGFYESESQLFETTAVATQGDQKGVHYGSVSWGWRADNAGTMTIEPFKIASYGLPSNNFLSSREKWNADDSKQDIPTASNKAVVEKLWNECHVLENVDKTNPMRTIDFYREVARIQNADKDAIALLRRSHISRFWVSLDQNLKTQVTHALNKGDSEILTDIRTLFSTR